MTDASELRNGERPREASTRLDTALNLLASRRRRTILRVLFEQSDDTIAFSELATEIIAREGGEHTIDRDMVIIDLHHAQLPKLVDAGVVEYDQRSGIVRYDGNDEIEALLRENRPVTADSLQ